MRRHLILAAAAVSLALPPTLLAGPVLAQSGNPLNSIFSCQASGNKQAGGAAVGAILGGVLGNTTAGKKSKGTSTVLGAALGAAAGSYIGCRMQTSDQQRAQAATEQALQYGENTTWDNPETGARGRVRMVSSAPYDDRSYDRGYDRDRYNQPVSLSDIRFAQGVQPQRRYVSAAGRYQVAGRTSLRGAPTRDSAVLSRLQDGDTIEALARVHSANGDWLLVGRGRTAIGYVSEERVTPLSQSYAYDDRDGRDRYSDRNDRGDRGSQRMCRTFDQELTTGRGETETQRYTACQTASGEWVVQG